MCNRPILGFDTSVFNRLIRCSAPEPFVAAILSGYDVRIPGMSFEEIAATRNCAMRMKLLGVCGRLLQFGRCIMPAHYVLELHIKNFHADPIKYNWLNVKVRGEDIEAEIQSGELLKDEELVEQHAKELRRLQDEFEGFFTRLADPTGGPNSFADWLVLSQRPGGSFWNTARVLYEGAFGHASTVDTSLTLTTPPDEATLKTFLEVCPPVRALVYALELTLYDRSLRAENQPAYKAGRNDQMMAIYLPYCEQFVTADGQQQKGLHEVAMAAKIPVKVQLYADFWSSHMIGA